MAQRSWVHKAGAVVLAGILLVGCARGDEQADQAQDGSKVEDSYPEGVIGNEPGGQPRDGGTLTIAGQIEPRSLDPIVTIAAPTTGGIEMINIFDTLLRYDAATGELVPQLAESIANNDDYTEFTLTLRDGVKFSDGTPVDAEAVVWSLKRYSSAKNAPEGVLWNENVKDVRAADNKTVVITLAERFPSFPNMLSTGPGMIVAKASDAGGQFKPIGAGPFVLKEHTVGEHIVLAANRNYWGGKPRLAELRTVALGSQDTGLEALDSGQVQAVFLSSPDLVVQRLKAGQRGYLNYTSSWGVTRINAAKGRPGADIRVRTAIALAINPQQLADRAYGGAGDIGTSIFSKQSKWYNEDSDRLGYDPEKARKLLDEAKADGYDGSFVYNVGPDPKMRDMALALKAQWEAVGFRVEIDAARSNSDFQARQISGDYDVSRSALNIREFDPYSKFDAALRTGGGQLLGMATSPERDAILDEVKAAATDEDMKAAIAKLEKQIAQEVPYVPHIHSWEFITWNDTVHEVTGAANAMLLFDKAWIE
ncbi:ABC transporter substrate-binding protein [Enemella sp. A6]|uniref:ABC transporter substrate-binding protein n=1 Tax=Enemella sp. A6 TaxID=3440152 RepID=UPI003EB8D17B